MNHLKVTIIFGIIPFAISCPRGSSGGSQQNPPPPPPPPNQNQGRGSGPGQGNPGQPGSPVGSPGQGGPGQAGPGQGGPGQGGPGQGQPGQGGPGQGQPGGAQGKGGPGMTNFKSDKNKGGAGNAGPGGSGGQGVPPNINGNKAAIGAQGLCQQFGQGHSACLSKNGPKNGPACGSGTNVVSGLSPEHKQEIINAHNEKRRQIATGQEPGQPKASNMKKLMWDEDLAVVAQLWVNQCKFLHDAGSSRVTPVFQSVGQNMFMFSSRQQHDVVPFTQVVDAWFKEVKKFDSKNIDPFVFDKTTGHYSQVAWANTSHVGCGQVGFQDKTWWKVIVACNYGPAGNVVGQTMYKTGEACSNCDEGTQCENSLCALGGGQQQQQQQQEVNMEMNKRPNNQTQDMPPPIQGNGGQPVPPGDPNKGRIVTGNNIPQKPPLGGNPGGGPFQKPGRSMTSLPNLCSKYGSQHTACLPTVGPSCGTGSENGKGFTDIEKQEIVKAHNDKRKQVAAGQEARQPKAANMLQLAWDENLALVAQRWADQCTFGHDKDRSVPAFGQAGQNVMMFSSSNRNRKFPPQQSVDAWYNEVKQFDPNNVQSFKFSMETGHYTQVVWGNTSHIGCGTAGYMKGNMWTKIDVCNYGPAGNVLSTPMYETGEPCSKCPQGTKCQDSLCAF